MTVPSNTTRAQRLDIPYLGPDPPTSRQVVPALRVLLLVATLVSLGRALLFLHRASLDTRLARGPTADVVEQLRSNKSSLDAAAVAMWASIVAVVVLDVVWRSRRRGLTKASRTKGEAYLESPMNWVTPIWLRFAMAGAAMLAILAAGNSSITTRTPVSSYAAHRHWSAVWSLALACLWGLHLLLTVIADRSHDHRVARSAAARSDPTSVPYVAPVSEYQASPGGEPSGIGWVFRTAGLFFLALVGLIFVLAGAGGIASHPLSGLAGLLIGIAICAIVVRSILRRRQRARS